MKGTNEQIAMRVSLHTILLNILLSAFKLLAGICGHSSAMVSDAVHSLSDVLSTIIVMAGVKMANKQADKEHPYGHERLECVAAMILAAILLATGLGIGYGGVKAIFSGGAGALPIPGVPPLVAAMLSIAVKEGMYWYTRAAANQVHSGALMADAWHHRSDALSSIGSLIGIAGARMGLPVLDPIASLVICAFILKAAFDILRDAISKMTDRACDDATIAEINALVLRQEGVAGIDLMRTRLFGDKIYVDVEISMDGRTTLQQSHAVAEAVHDAIESRFENVKHCMVHTNPACGKPQ